MPIPRLALTCIFALCTPAPMALCQLTGTTGIVPPSRTPQPLDSTIVRQQAAQGMESMSSELRIKYGKKTAEWTPAKLAAVPHENLKTVNEETHAEQTFSGVPLMALLVELGVAQKPRGKDLRLYVLAEGRDGSKVVYSLGEISPDVHEGSVLLADSVDGKPLGDSGPIALICSGERRPARWIRGVVSIKVQAAD